MNEISLEVPQSVTSHLIVVTDQVVVDPLERVHELLADPAPPGLEGVALAREALEMIGTPRLQLHSSRRRGSSRWREQLAELAGTGEREMLKLQRSPQLLVVTSTEASAAQPRRSQLTRFVARVLAKSTNGWVVDLPSNQLLPDGCRPETEGERFVLGDDWLAVFLGPNESTVCPVRAYTAGLVRFGLPELEVQVPVDQMLTAVSMLRGVASRTLHDHWAWLASHPTQTTRIVPDHQELISSDLWRFWGVPPQGQQTRFTVRLILQVGRTPADPSILKIVSPEQDEDGNPA